MTIHPFPKSHRGSCGGRNPQVAGFQHFPAAVSSLSNDSAGIVHAIEPSGRAEAIPASFSFLSAFNGSDHTQQDQRHVPILVTEFRVSGPKGRDLSSRAEQIRLAAILAERASADLLARASHCLNSLTLHGDQLTMKGMQRASKSLRESSSDLLA